MVPVIGNDPILIAPQTIVLPLHQTGLEAEVRIERTGSSL